MAYTNVWNSNSPPGSQDAKTADDEFRKFRLDIEERMEDKFITDVTVDPWVVKPEILGNVTGKNVCLHHGLFSPEVTYDGAGPTGNIFTRSTLFVENVRGSQLILFGGLVLPPGVTVTDIVWVGNRNNGSTNISFIFEAADLSSQTIFTHSTVATTANGIQSVVASGLSVVIAGVRAYYLKVVLPYVGSGGRFYGAEVFYNVPDCRNTV